MRAHGLSSLAFAALLFAMPALARAAGAPATVVCKDGSTSKGGSGACSGHGGVDQKATEASAKQTAPAAPPAGSSTQAAPAPAPKANAAAEGTAAAPAKAKNTDPTGAIAKC